MDQPNDQVTKNSLRPGQLRTFEIIGQLSFGRIEGLWICNGDPSYAHAPRIVEEIKLNSASSLRIDRSNNDFELAKEFESLFAHMERLGNGVVDIEVRHAAPFRLIVYRTQGENVR